MQGTPPSPSPSPLVFDSPPQAILFLVCVLASCCDARTYRMGFSGFPPSNNITLALQAITTWMTRSDFALFDLTIPFGRLLAGETPAAILASEVNLRNRYGNGGITTRGVTFDLTNPVNRSLENPDLVAANRSLIEPAIRDMAINYMKVAVDLLAPQYVVVAKEVNLIRKQCSGCYLAVFATANFAAGNLTSIGPPGKLVGVSVNVEAAYPAGLPFEGIEQDFTNFPFVQLLGLSTYPYLGQFGDPPSNIPLDYFTKLLGARSLPMFIAEGGYIR